MTGHILHNKVKPAQTYIQLRADGVWSEVDASDLNKACIDGEIGDGDMLIIPDTVYEVKEVKNLEFNKRT